MKNLVVKYFIIVIIVFIFQISIFSIQPVAGVKPDLLLVLVVINGLLTGINKGCKLGLGAGLLQDIFFSGIPGKFTIIKFIAGGLTGLLEGKLFKNNYFFPFLLVFIVTIYQEIVLFLFSARSVLNINFLTVFWEVIIPVALYNGVLSLFLYPIFYKILKIGDKRLWIRN